MKNYNPPLLILTSIFVIFLSASCVQQYDKDVERGSNYKFQEGFPEARISAIGLFDANGNAGINVAADIVYGSLIYKSAESTLIAEVQLSVNIIDNEAEKTAKRESYSFEITSQKNSITNSQDVFTYSKRIPISPGDYLVRVEILDKTSGKQTVRETDAYIPNPNNSMPNLTTVQLLSKDMDVENPQFLPVTTYDVPGKVDSLLFRFQVTNTQNDTLEIYNRLIEFQSDTSVSRRMSAPEYSVSSIQYEGIEYDRSETLQENRRIILQPGSVLIEFKIPMLDRGNYRFQVNITGSMEENEEAEKARDFSVKSENYPTLKTPFELARPLVYLMDEDQYDSLMSITSPEALKKEIDHFWLSNIKNEQTAKDVIALYYERVEMANKQFSNFKEGWKTDPGRVFILFGPPWYVDRDVQVMQWSYSYNRDDPESNYFFDKPRINNKFFPFNHFVLFRRQFYFGIEYRQRQNWLTGRILTRQLPF